MWGIFFEDMNFGADGGELPQKESYPEVEKVVE
jgi:hypothetical protein